MSKTCEVKNWSIRPCRNDDLDALRDICVETSSLPLRNEKDRWFLLLMYCDPYVKFADDCFAAVDPDDKPIGYILCAADTRRFFKSFRQTVIPQAYRLGFSYGVSASGIYTQQMICSVFAPAHLHIDLTAAYRRKGIGSELIKVLKEDLRSKGIGRVELTCGSKNKAAVEFYRHNGFRTILKCFGCCVMRTNTGL